jgi:pyruvate,orthophosphate dikinase
MDMSSRADVDGIMMILENPTPEDIPLVLSADGLLSSKGGSTSHAAVAVNGIGHKDYNAVMGVPALRVKAVDREAVFTDESGNERARIRKGDVVSIHGSTGAVYVGSRELERA